VSFKFRTTFRFIFEVELYKKYISFDIIIELMQLKLSGRP